MSILENPGWFASKAFFLAPIPSVSRRFHAAGRIFALCRVRQNIFNQSSITYYNRILQWTKFIVPVAVSGMLDPLLQQPDGKSLQYSR